MTLHEKVSIIMPCYNCARTVTKTLDSVLSQTFQDFKIYIVNDGSTDSTPEILTAFAKSHPNKIQIKSQTNQGQTRAKNNALQEVRGEYVAFIDSDDVWFPNKLEKQVQCLDKNLMHGLCYTDGYYINEYDDKTGFIGVDNNLQGQCLTSLMMGNGIVASSVMVRRSLLDQVGHFDEQFTACENWELWCRISSISELFVIREPMVGYRRHSHNMSWNFERLKENRLKVIAKNAQQFKSQIPEINKLTKQAFFQAYLFFGENALWHLDLLAARLNLKKAMLYHPFSLKTYKLYIKTLLGAATLAKIRKARGVKVVAPI